MRNEKMRHLFVESEFARLEEVILGTAEGLRLPVMNEEMAEEMASLTLGSKDFWLEGGGRLLTDSAADLAANLSEQIEGLATLLESRGVVVHRPRQLSQAEQEYPGGGHGGGSLMFMRDPFVVVGSHIIEGAMRFPFRRRQRYAVRHILEEIADRDPGCSFVALPEPNPSALQDGFLAGCYLEGGDVLVLGQKVFVGLSGHASSSAGAAWLQRYLGASYEVAGVPMRKGYVHLDCVLSLVRPGLALACLEALPSGLPSGIEDWDIIEVTLEEARHLACNGLILDADTYIMDQAQGRIGDQLLRKGVDVIAIPYDLPSLFGGGLRCSHHPLRRIA
jgi:N-dimethylarginine dimethylaminohydrolase